MKKKLITIIMFAMLAFVFAFAACQPDDPGKTPGDDTTTYTVTFDAGDGTVTPATAEAEEGSTITEPTATYAGHTLEGWYKESAHTNKWDFSTDTVQSDITLYAKWSGSPVTTTYTVTFDAGDGTVTPATAEAEEGSTITEPTATYAGHTLEGWYKESAYTNKWDFSADTVQSDITLYANWTENAVTPATYTVTFDVNGGAPMQNPTQTVTYGQAFNLGVTTRSKFYFDGWTYEGNLITDANGAGKGVWSIEKDVTVTAKWSAGADDTGDTDVSGLIAAIANMGHNYTSAVYYNSGLQWAYDHYCTEDGIYMMYGSEYASSGFVFHEVEGESLAYFFELKDGLALIDEEPYTWMDGDPYTRDYVYGRDYHASVIKPEYYVNLGNGVYSCQSEYLYRQGRDLIYENDPSEILITVTDGYIDYIYINDFTDRDFGGTDSVWIYFDDIGSTSIDKYLITERPPYVPQLPSGTDPDKPQAPTTYESDGVKPVDAFDTSVYVNGANDEALPELKAAIDAARESIRYYFEDYFDDTYNKNSSVWDPTSQYYIAQFEGYKSYVANAYYDYSPRVVNYVVVSGGKVYRIDHDGDIIKYVERDATFEERTFGGNYFNKLNASMFEQSATNPNVYTVKSAHLNTVGEILFDAARDAKGVGYNGNPSIVYRSVTITLNNDGQFENILAERIFDFGDGRPDIQQMKFSFDYETPLVMPYELQYTADELVLKNAIAAMGNNYTLDHIYYDGTQITEYYADEGIWKWYGYEWGSSGFVYINDYAYFMSLRDGVLEVSENIWWGFDAPKGENNEYYYFRAWMNLYYLPLIQLDVKDFTRTSDNVFQLKSSVLNKYDGMFFDFEDEGGMNAMSIILGEDGKIARIECTCTVYISGLSEVVTSTVYIGDVGTTTLPV